MTNYNAVSVNQNDNRDTVKAKQIWNNGQYNRNLYGSDDSIKPTPNTGLISLKKEDVEGTSKKLFRLRHCFDYYKDLPNIEDYTKNMSGETVPDYLKMNPDGSFKYFDSIKYWTITRDMYWRGVSDEGSFTWGTNSHTGGNNGISYWKRSTVYNSDNYWYQYWMSDDHSYGDYYYYSALVYPVFKNGSSKHFSKLNRIEYSYTYEVEVVDYYNYYIYQSGSGGGGWGKVSYETYSSHTGDKKTEAVYKKEKRTGYAYKSKNGSSSLNNPGISPIVVEFEYCDDFGLKSFNNAFHKGSKSNVSYKNGFHYNYLVPYDGTLYRDGSYTYRQDRTGCLKYPYSSDTYFNMEGYSLYVDYVPCTPYVITKEELKDNPNYYFPELRIGGYQVDEKTGWDNSGRSCIGSTADNDRIYPTLMHEYIEPTICPYDEKYVNNIDIGLIFVKYNMINPASQNVLDSKTIPVKFTAYKCEAYKKK